MIRSVLSWRRSGVRESATLCRLDQCGSQCSCPGVRCSVCLEPRASSRKGGQDFDSGQQWGVAAGPFCLYGREMGMACRATAHLFQIHWACPGEFSRHYTCACHYIYLPLWHKSSQDSTEQIKSQLKHFAGRSDGTSAKLSAEGHTQILTCTIHVCHDTH